MTRKRVPLTPPNDALPEGEANRFLARFKSSLSKRWSFTGMETLYEIFDLEAFLWALERTSEAVSVAVSVATAIPSPPKLPGGGFNYNIWCPATMSHALFLHLAPASRERVDASRSILLSDPGIARDNTAYIEEGIASARYVADDITPLKPLKSTFRELARHLGTLVLYYELGNAGDPAFRNHIDEISALIPRIRAKLEGLLRLAD